MTPLRDLARVHHLSAEVDLAVAQLFSNARLICAFEEAGAPLAMDLDEGSHDQAGELPVFLLGGHGGLSARTARELR